MSPDRLRSIVPMFDDGVPLLSELGFRNSVMVRRCIEIKVESVLHGRRTAGSVRVAAIAIRLLDRSSLN